jgi:outer membrane protein
MKPLLRWHLPALALASAALAPAAHAVDLVEAWQAAALNDKGLAVVQAAHAAAQPRRDQAAALWRPTVAASATVGVASSQTDTTGAQFTAPGLGTSNGVGFNTSVTGGTATRWALSAVQPLYNRERRAQQQQLALSVDGAELALQAGRQALMLRTAERYFDLALAEEAVRVQQQQLVAVQRASDEALDRFKLGAVPVTDTHEAQARLAGVRAEALAAQTDLQLKRQALADSTALSADRLTARLPGGNLSDGPQRPLDPWLADALAGNPTLRQQQLAGDIARQEAAKYSLGASPRVDLVAQAMGDRLSGSGHYGSASNAASQQSIGLQVTVPLFTGGWRDAKQSEALLLADQAGAELAQAQQQVAQQVRSSWMGLNLGVQRVQALREALAASLSRRDATTLGVTVGHRTTLDLLGAETDRAAAQLSLAQARVGLWLDRLRLAALAGQLDEAALRAANADLMPAP